MMCSCDHHALPVIACETETDGTIWEIREACPHGIKEITPVYCPLGDVHAKPPAADQAVAVESEA